MPQKIDSHLAPSPIFIIGSYRSATSVMTWALGQHPNIFPLEETHFIYKLAADLDYLYEIGSRPGLRSFIGLAQLTRREFRTHFGRACNALIESARQRTIQYAYSEKFLDKRSSNIELKFSDEHPKQRWIDGTPENSHYVLALFRLFPNARFIHILRNPKQVATSLTHFSSAGAIDYTEEDAYRTWIRLVQACALAEEALGPQRVLRIHYEDIVANPRAVVQQSLAFVGEPFDSACLLPLREKLNSSIYKEVGDDSIESNIDSPAPWINEAFSLYRQLLNGDTLLTSRRAAFRTLQHMLGEYQLGLRPEENERLLAELKSTKAHLKLLKAPFEVLNWGPQDIVAGAPFNMQPDGNSALWVQTRNAPQDMVIELGGVPLKSFVHSAGDLVTALVPAELTQQPCQLQLILRSAETGEIGGPFTCELCPNHTHLDISSSM